jgi:hypothetical protein
MDTPLILFLIVGRAGRLSHFSSVQNHDVVFLSVAVVAGAAILGFSSCSPFIALEVGDVPELIISASTLSVSTTLWTNETDPFCCGRGPINSNAARMLATMTKVAKKVRSTLGFARWLMTVKGPGSEDSDGSESASEMPWTLSIAGSWTSIMMIKRRERDEGMETPRKESKREERGHQGNVTIYNKVRSAFAVLRFRSQMNWKPPCFLKLSCSLKPRPYP